MKKILFSLTMLTVLLSGCVYDDSELFGIVDKNNIEEVGTPLNVTASISEGTSNLRAVITGTTFPNPSDIGVFSTNGGGTATTAKYSYDGSTWSSTTQLYFVNPTATVYAFYPYSAIASPTSSSTISISLGNENSLTGAGQTDYMYTGLATVNKVSGAYSASLGFKHALTKVSFIVKKGTNFVGNGKLSNVTLTKGGLTSATMVVSSGVVEGTSTSISFSNNTTPATINENNATPLVATCSGLVAPNTSLTSVEVSMTIDGILYKKAMPTNPATWTAGNNYTYTVTVTAGSLSIGTATITDWTNVTGDSFDY